MTKRRSRLRAFTRSSSGAYTVRRGGGSVVGAATTGPTMITPGCGIEGAAGELRSTETVPVITNSRPSIPSESLGSERYASGLVAQVFHGTAIVAFEPETERACATASLVFA